METKGLYVMDALKPHVIAHGRNSGQLEEGVIHGRLDMASFDRWRIDQAVWQVLDRPNTS